MLLPLDGADSDFTAFLHAEAVGLAGVHLGVGRAVAHQCALADLRVDTPGDEEGDVDVVVLELQGLVEAEQGMFGGAISRTQWEAEQSR